MVTNSSSSPELLAKTYPPVSLSSHSEAVAKATAELVDDPVITDRLSACNVDLAQEHLRELGKFTGQLHDTGKAHPEWQRIAQENCDENKSVQLPPHSARSAFYAFLVANETGVPLSHGIASVLAILHHHTPMVNNRMTIDHLRDVVADIEQLTKMSNMLASSEFQPVSVDTESRNSFRNAVTHYQKLEPRNEEYRSIGMLATILRSALIQADHHASADEDTVPKPTGLDPAELSLFDSLRPFQQKVANTASSRLIGMAGCGEGKTHSALQWGKRMIENEKANRLVFAMPTQVTTNNLLLSLTGVDGDSTHVPRDKAVLYHSASEAFYTDDASETWDLSQPFLNERARRWFQRPVTVTTVDHVLSTLINGYQWASVARGNLVQSAVIFDELHAYDDQMTGHILGSIEVLSELGIPWYVMSATLPPQLRNHKALSNAEEVQSDGRIGESLPPREPFTVDVREELLSADEVLDVVEESPARRIMVVCNTVSRSRELARELADAGEDITYYSSAFTRDHRTTKEEEIRREFGQGYDGSTGRKFLVCTQVGEISLDLSADLLLTDIAPIDAVIQRAGRLHRTGVRPIAGACSSVQDAECPQCDVLPADFTYRTIVYAPLDQHEHWLPYASDRDTTEWQLLTRTKDVLEQADQYRFDRSLDWVDDVYDPLDISFRSAELSAASRKDLLYGPSRRVAPTADSGREDLQLRSSSQYRQAVFMQRYRDPDGTTWEPANRWQQVHDCEYAGDCGIHRKEQTDCDQQFWQFASKYMVEIPTWWLQSDSHPVTVAGKLHDSTGPIDGTLVATLDYTYQFGADPMSTV